MFVAFMKTGKFLLLPKDLQNGQKIGKNFEIKQKNEWRREKKLIVRKIRIRKIKIFLEKMVITVLVQVTKVSENAILFGKGGGREGTSERHCTVFTGLQKNRQRRTAAAGGSETLEKP